MTAEERVRSLHSKVVDRQRMQERRKTGVIGAAGIILTACLLLLIFNQGMVDIGGSSRMYTGATMLFEDAGGHVLVAVAAFMAGVVVTVLIQRNKTRDEDHEENAAMQKENQSEKE